MGDNYTSFIKLYNKAATSKKFQKILKEQFDQTVKKSLLYRCPGCNFKVAIEHSVDACVKEKYQNVAREIHELKSDVGAQVALQQKADSLRSKYKHILK